MSAPAMDSEESDLPPLSTLSQKLKRDTFIFSTAVPTSLVFGLNQKITRASSADIHRWSHLREMGPTLEWPSSAPAPDFLLRPVKFRPLAILAYVIEPVGDPIPETSDDPLAEGYYGYFFPDGGKYEPDIAGDDPNVLPFDELEEYFRYLDIDWIEYEKNEVPMSLSEEIRQTCRSRCVVSGRTDDTIVSWIFPPAYAHLGDRDPSESGEYEPDKFRNKANLFVIQKDIFAELWRNAFSFDPTANYRTVVFREMPVALREILPERLDVEALSPGAGKYIAMHFNYTLVVNILYGDIRDQYSHNNILSAMEMLGVGIGSGSDALFVPYDDPQWDTVLGRAIRASLLRSERTLAA